MQILMWLFSMQPAKRSAYSSSGSEKVFAPVERELVFDVVGSYS